MTVVERAARENILKKFGGERLLTIGRSWEGRPLHVLLVQAVALPLVFYFLIKLTSDGKLMGEFVNNPFQKWFAIICSGVIVIASIFTVATLFF